MKKRSLRKTLKSPFFLEAEREDWKSKLNKTIYFLEVLESRFPYWTLPMDLEMVTIEGSKMEHKIGYEELKDALCETGLIEAKRYYAKYVGGDGVKGEMPAFKYRIIPKGMNFLNNIRMKDLNKKLFWLTIFIVLLGIVQILILISSLK